MWSTIFYKKPQEVSRLNRSKGAHFWRPNATCLISTGTGERHLAGILQGATFWLALSNDSLPQTWLSAGSHFWWRVQGIWWQAPIYFWMGKVYLETSASVSFPLSWQCTNGLHNKTCKGSTPHPVCKWYGDWLIRPCTKWGHFTDFLTIKYIFRLNLKLNLIWIW